MSTFRPIPAFLLVGGMISCGSAPLPPAQGPSVRVHREASLDGRLAEFPRPGRVTLLDFWATSCAPCKLMMPSLEKLWQERKSEGLDIIGISSDDNPGLVAAQLKTLGVSYPNVVDPSGNLRGDFRVGPVPHSIVIDRQGKIRLSVEGGKPDDLQRVIDGVNGALGE